MDADTAYSRHKHREKMNALFPDLPTPQPKYPDKFCRTCKHRERWECGGSIIQYCGVRHSNRTFNKLLKIKVTNPACDAYEEE